MRQIDERTLRWWRAPAVWIAAAIAAIGGLCAAAAGPEESLSEPVTVIHAGWLLDVPGKPPRGHSTVVVRGARIVAIAAGFRAPQDLGFAADSRVLDLSQQFVLPGLIDCHVHITNETSPQDRLNLVTQSDADRAIAASVYARRTLEAGFTTVRDLGSRGSAIFALRDRIASGWVPGPRVIAAGEAVTPTGGHADANGFREDVAELLRPAAVCDGADSCRRAVREQVKRGADVIKLTATGGVMSLVSAGFGQQLTDDELQAIVSTAHALGRKVAAHAHDTAGINAAIRAGVDSVEHATYADASSYKLLRGAGIYVVPTQMTIEAASAVANPVNGYPAVLRAKAQQILPRIPEALANLHRAGVKIAFGTDAGVFPHGQNAREFQYMVRAGMSPMEAIRAATADAAQLLGLEREIGTLEVGKSADIIAVARDPLQDVVALMSTTFVMRAGNIYKRSGRMAEAT